MSKWAQYLMVVLLFSLCAERGVAKNLSNDICGFWFTENNKALIHIYWDTDSMYTGIFCWLKDSLENDLESENYGQPVKDKNTNELLLGSQIVKDLIFDDETTWNGTIYNPLSGKTFKCSMKLSDDKNTITAKGYMGIAILGKTVNWLRKMDL